MKIFIISVLLVLSFPINANQTSDAYERLAKSSKMAQRLRQTFEEELNRHASLDPRKAIAIRCLSNNIKEEDIAYDIANILREYLLKSDAEVLSEFYEGEQGSYFSTIMALGVTGVHNPNSQKYFDALDKSLSGSPVEVALNNLLVESKNIESKIREVIPKRIEIAGKPCRSLR